MDGFGIYAYQDVGGAAPVVDECGGHFGPTDTGEVVYHYHSRTIVPYHLACQASTFLLFTAYLWSSLQAKGLHYVLCCSKCPPSPTAAKRTAKASAKGITRRRWRMCILLVVVD